MVSSSSLVKLASSGIDFLLSLLDGRGRDIVLGEAAEDLGDGIADFGEACCLAGVAAGLSLSSFFRVAEAAADRARLAVVSCRGLLAGLLLEGVSGRNNLLEA